MCGESRHAASRVFIGDFAFSRATCNRDARSKDLFLALFHFVLDTFSDCDISPYQHAEVLNDRSSEDARHPPAESATGHPAGAHYGSPIGQGWQDEDTALVENGR